MNIAVPQLEISVNNSPVTSHLADALQSTNITNVKVGGLTVDEQRITPDTNSTNNEAVLRILEPASKNLVSIESARVYNVYDQMLKQMNILLNLEKIYKFLESEMPLKEIASKSSIFARIDGILELRKEFVGCPDDLSIEDKIKSESRHLCRTFHHHRELERLVLAFLGMDKLQPTQCLELNK